MVSERDALRRLAARLGADPMQIQGPGGNVSIKEVGRLIVKASGARLADALERDVFADLDRQDMLAAYRVGRDLAVPAGAPRPSIETSFHALIPHRVVLHTHSVCGLAHLIGLDGQAAALMATQDLGAVLVPYAMPGRPLTAAIEAAGAAAPVHLLANHGLIVGANGVAEAAALLEDVERRLHRSLGPDLARGPDLGPEPVPTGWRRCTPELAAPRARAIAGAGAYWPDAVVFLGASVGTDTHPARVDEAGGLLREDASLAAMEMLDCLGAVMARLPEGWTPAPLPFEEVALLMNWEAEAFRRARDAR